MNSRNEVDRNELARVLRRTLSKRESEGGEPTDSYLPPGVSGGPFADFSDPRYAARFAAASRLYPPERYRAFARLVRDLERRASPLVAYSVDASYNLFSSRLGCQLYQPLYGVDLGALCAKN